MEALDVILRQLVANIEANSVDQDQFEQKYQQMMGMPYCHTCEGSKRVSSPWQRGQSQTSQPCHDCSSPDSGQSLERKLRASGIEPLWANEYRFDRWDANRNSHLMPEFTTVRSWSAHPNGLLLIAGGVGTGKTHIALATAIENVITGMHVRYTEAEGLLGKMKAAMGREDDSADRVYESWGTAPSLLVLDDLGTEQHTEYSRTVLENLLSWRLVRLRPTVVTTNTGLEDYSNRLKSRLHDKGRVTVVKLDGADMRPTQPPVEE